MDNAQKFDVVCIGYCIKDTIIYSDVTRYVDGGGLCYSTFTVSGLGKKVTVFTRLAKEDEYVITSFKNAGIACFPILTASSTLIIFPYILSEILLFVQPHAL